MYGASRYVSDLVRASIVCGTLKEVAALLEIIAADPFIEIVRGKQRFTNAYDGACRLRTRSTYLY